MKKLIKKRNIESNLLVTGGCGFIGSNFIRYLLEDINFKGRIINVDKLSYAGNTENLYGIKENFPENYHFFQTDICDKKSLTDIFLNENIDVICHFAAESHVDRSIHRPDDFIQTNIIGTFNLLELARQFQDRIKIFHHVSTDEVFGTLGKTGHFTEKTPYDPRSPYSASKAASDHLVRSYFHTYELPITISNCSNNYGHYQFPEKLIPLMILNAINNKALPVYGDGKNIRDWLFVKDHCTAIYLIMTQGRPGETYIIGGNTEMQNIEIVEMICDILDELFPPKKPRKELITYVKDRPGHDFRYAIDFTKLKKELAWKPEESFSSGIRKTVNWYIDNEKWVKRVKSGEYRDWIKKHYK